MSAKIKIKLSVFLPQVFKFYARYVDRKFWLPLYKIRVAKVEIKLFYFNFLKILLLNDNICYFQLIFCHFSH